MCKNKIYDNNYTKVNKGKIKIHLLVPVLVSYCCCNKLPQTERLKTIPICYPRSQKSKFSLTELQVSAGLHSFCSVWGKIYFLPSSGFQKPPTFLVCGPFPCNITSTSASIVTSSALTLTLLPPLIKTLMITSE